MGLKLPEIICHPGFVSMNLRIMIMIRNRTIVFEPDLLDGTIYMALRLLFMFKHSFFFVCLQDWAGL